MLRHRAPRLVVGARRSCENLSPAPARQFQTSEVIDMTGNDKRQTGRFDKWRTKRRLKRQQRAARPLPLLDPQQRAREDARRGFPPPDMGGGGDLGGGA